MSDNQEKDIEEKQLNISDLIIKTEKVEWRKLKPFQPDSIKKTTKKQMQKLKNSLLNNGFAMSIYVYEDNKSNIWIIDGHHRIKVLEILSNEGHKIPDKFTCSFLDVKNKKHAKKLVLAFNSHYAKIEKEGLLDWVDDLDMEELKEEFNFDFELKERRTKRYCPHCGEEL